MMKLLYVAIFFFTSLTIAAQNKAEPNKHPLPIIKQDTIPRIAIISAFDTELAKLRDSTVLSHISVVNGRTLWFGKLRGHNVVLLLSGISVINATMTTEALLNNYRISSIIFSGIAGGVNPELHVGDVTVASRWGNYQNQMYARQIDSGWDTETRKTEFSNFGMIFPRSSSVARIGRTADSLESRFWFPVDSNLLSLAGSLSADLTLKRCLGSGDCLEYQPRLVVGGNGVSGSTFVDNADYRTYVWNTFQANALDTETSAVALVAYVHRIPFIAFRSLSDLAGGGAGKNEARTFGKLAAENSAVVVLSFLAKIPGNKF